MSPLLQWKEVRGVREVTPVANSIIKYPYVSRKLSSTDLNTIVKTGFYTLQNSITNGPSGVSSDWGNLIVVGNDDDTLAQILIEPLGKLWSRSRLSGTWREWIKASNNS